MAYLLTYVLTFLDVMTFMVFISAFVPLGRGKGQCAAVVAAVSAVLSILVWVLGDNPLRVIVVLVCLFFLALSLFRGDWRHQLLALLVVFIFSGILDTASLYGISTLMGITVSELVWKKLLYTVIVITTKLIELLAAYVFAKFRRSRSGTPIRGPWLLLTILFPAASLMMLSVVFWNFQDQGDLSLPALLFCFVLALANGAIVYLIHVMEKRTREEEQLQLLNQQMQLQTGSILALERSYRSQRAATHEFRNQLQTIGALLDRQCYAEAAAYVAQLQQSRAIRVLAVNTHHPIMDAILNQKYQQAQESGIDIQFQVSDLSGLTIPTDALVVLFSNLLDNAVEGCARFDGERIIRCSIVASRELYISIRNTSPAVTITDGSIPTSKPDPGDHGFGLSGIRRILDQLRGEYAFQYTDGWFQFVAEIPLS